MRGGDPNKKGEPSSSFFIAVPSNLPPPIMNHRWASDSASQMFGEETTGPISKLPPANGGGGGDNQSTTSGDKTSANGHHVKVHGGDAKAGHGAGGAAAGEHDGDDDTGDGGMMGAQDGGAASEPSPWDRMPPPPPPIFDPTIPRQRFIAKIMRWYQCIETWCDERGFVKYDRDRLIVAPPPRPPLFVEGEAVFAIPDAARMSPYDVNQWAARCYHWWEHIHKNFHRIHREILGQSVVSDKAETMERPRDKLIKFVALHALCDDSRDSELRN